jgi:uncharacterized repeat protein (TIGR01451 family)
VRRWFRFPAVLCATLGVGLAGWASPSGAAVTIGSDLARAVNGGNPCASTAAHCVFLQVSIMGNTLGFSAPFDGLIRRWRIRGDFSAAYRYRLVVLRPQASGAYLGVGATPAVATTGADPTTTISMHELAVPIAVRAGDVIALDGLNGATVPLVDSLSVGSGVAFGNVDFGDGVSHGGSPFSDTEYPYNADVEPDLDRDGFGDESTDLCVGVFGSVSGCLEADLALTKTASQGAENDVVTYTLTARNNGPDPVTDAAISDTLPAGASFVSSTAPGGPCSASGRSVSCTVGALASGASQTLTITARLKAGNQTNTATISSAALALAATRAAGAGESNPANNTATATVNVAALAVSNPKVNPATFRLGSLLPKFTRKPPVGTTISFTLSEPAKATLTFSQPKTGRKAGRRCKPLTRSNRRKPRCTIPNVRGTLSFVGHADTNKLRFQGRLSRTRKLKPGRYTLTVTATDSAGNRSRPRSTRFTIVR